MKNNTENLNDDNELSDDDTMELPLLDIEAEPLDSETPSGGSAPRPQSQALLWLKHMESELDGLQARWAQLAAELGERDAVLAAKDREIEERAADLLVAEEHGAVLNEKLVAAGAEMERMQLTARQSRAEHEDLARRFAALGTTNGILLGKIQDLELYIDGRQKDWSTLHAELAKHRADLSDKDRSLEEKTKESAHLHDRALELEKQCSDLIDRQREREEAYRALEQKLSQEVDAAAQLKAALAQNENATKDALDVAEATKQLLDSLQEDLQRSDGAIAELTARNDALAALAGESETLTLKLVEAEHALATLANERDELASSLAQAGAKVVELGRKADTAADEARTAQGQLAGLQAEVRRLEAELGDGHETLHLLDKNLKRINVLGASLQGVERGGGTEWSTSRSNVHYIGGADHGARPRTKVFVSIDNPTTLRFPLNKQNTTIGRARESDIRINGQFISRIHARVLAYAAGTVIEDLGSKNGIFVNSRPISRCTLKDGDVVSLGGKLDLRYVELDA
jgi:chromosome segregation ATPase